MVGGGRAVQFARVQSGPDSGTTGLHPARHAHRRRLHHHRAIAHRPTRAPRADVGRGGGAAVGVPGGAARRGAGGGRARAAAAGRRRAQLQPHAAPRGRAARRARRPRVHQPRARHRPGPVLHSGRAVEDLRSPQGRLRLLPDHGSSGRARRGHLQYEVFRVPQDAQAGVEVMIAFLLLMRTSLNCIPR